MFSIAGMHHGGAERVVANLCRNLDAQQFRTSVCWRVARGAIGQELLEEGFEVIGLPEVQPHLSPYLRFTVLKDLARKRGVDLIHTHDTGAMPMSGRVD